MKEISVILANLAKYIKEQEDLDDDIAPTAKAFAFVFTKEEIMEAVDEYFPEEEEESE